MTNSEYAKKLADAVKPIYGPAFCVENVGPNGNSLDYDEIDNEWYISVLIDEQDWHRAVLFPNAAAAILLEMISKNIGNIYDVARREINSLILANFQ